MAQTNSIWTSALDRQTFAKNIVALEALKCWPGPITTTVDDIPAFPGNYKLSLKHEAKLVADFSFLAACERGPNRVTAACIEESEHEGFTLRLAANRGILEEVKSAIGNILSCLQKCATKDISRTQCADRIFDEAIRLNANRILGRMSSAHFVPPKDSGAWGPKAPPSKQLLLIWRRTQRLRSLDAPTEDFETLQEDIETLQEAFAKLEGSSQKDRLLAIQNSVRAAYRATVNGASLSFRLQRLGCTETVANSRPVQQISKVANYWRICQSLANMSRCRDYIGLFSHAKLETVGAGAKKQRVHAEVQLIVHYEIFPKDPPPRIIGSSKQACYLCHAFVEAHGQFKVLRAHRTIHSSWIVPDRPEFTLISIARLQRALKQVNRGVLNLIKTSQMQRKAGDCQQQSLLDLELVDYPDQSVTTFTSNKRPLSLEFDVEGRIVKPKSQCSGHSSDTLKAKESGEHFEEHDSSTRQISKPQVRRDSAITGADEAQLQADIAAGSSVENPSLSALSSQTTAVLLDWFEILFDDAPVKGKRLTRIELSRNEGSSDSNQNVITVKDLLVNQELTYPLDEAGSNLTLVFQDEKRSLNASISISN